MKLVPLWLMVAAVARDVIIVPVRCLLPAFIGRSACARPSSANQYAVSGRIHHWRWWAGKIFRAAAWVATLLGALVFATVTSAVSITVDLRPAGLECRRPRAAARAGIGAHEATRPGCPVARGRGFRELWPGRNGEALAALRTPGTVPLWLWGASGSGKTHLLQAVARPRGISTAYFPLARPLALPPEALAGSSAPRALSRRCRRRSRRWSWERALFRLFNEAADCTPLDFCGRGAAAPSADRCLEDWRSQRRRLCGLSIHELDDDGRIEALRLRAAQRGLQLPYETSEYLLKRMPRDLRSLFDILDQLDEASLAAQRRLTIPFIRDALEKHARTKS